MVGRHAARQWRLEKKAVPLKLMICGMVAWRVRDDFGHPAPVKVKVSSRRSVKLTPLTECKTRNKEMSGKVLQAL